MLSKACEVGTKKISHSTFATDHNMYKPEAEWIDKGHDTCLLQFCSNSHFWISHSALGF